MAKLTLRDGDVETGMIVSAELGLHYWQIINGEIEPNEVDAAFCERIVHIWLAWRRAPDSYLEANRELLTPFVLGEWMASKHDGTTTRPEPDDDNNLRISEFYGLIFQGRRTSYTVQHNQS